MSNEEGCDALDAGEESIFGPPLPPECNLHMVYERVI